MNAPYRQLLAATVTCLAVGAAPAQEFDFAREGWIADFNDPINMLEMWITSSGNNDCQYGR